jgi:hypothetical protein
MGYVSLFFTLWNERKAMKFDKEYSTQYLSEMKFLLSKGIKYTWVYVNEEGYTVWKYKKEKRLWDALSEMYSED